MDYYETLDKARLMGREYADNGIAAGQTSPEDAPLSGEWAGAITLDDILRDLGAQGRCEDFERDDVADYWESGYFSAEWPDWEIGS